PVRFVTVFGVQIHLLIPPAERTLKSYFHLQNSLHPTYTYLLCHLFIGFGWNGINTVHVVQLGIH
ncbi:TPA: hypothetical protein ACGW44_004613, partial [Bacillus toyonensis]